jgi:hypothetical protein
VTLEETSRVLKVLLAVWPEKLVSPELTQAYQLAWRDLDYVDVNDAAGYWLGTGTFFPRPAELRTVVLDRVSQLPAPEVAWGEVKAALTTHGPGALPDWSTPVLQATMAALGWSNFCLSELDDEPAWRAHFYKTYAAYKERAFKETSWRALEGPPIDRTLSLVEGGKP